MGSVLGVLALSPNAGATPLLRAAAQMLTVVSASAVIFGDHLTVAEMAGIGLFSTGMVLVSFRSTA
jgi:uncharacterized membrane protein